MRSCFSFFAGEISLRIVAKLSNIFGNAKLLTAFVMNDVLAMT